MKRYLIPFEYGAFVLTVFDKNRIDFDTNGADAVELGAECVVRGRNYSVNDQLSRDSTGIFRFNRPENFFCWGGAITPTVRKLIVEAVEPRVNEWVILNQIAIDEAQIEHLKSEARHYGQAQKDLKKQIAALETKLYEAQRAERVVLDGIIELTRNQKAAE